MGSRSVNTLVGGVKARLLITSKKKVECILAPLPVCLRLLSRPCLYARPHLHPRPQPRHPHSPLATSHMWDLIIAIILIITVFSNPLSMAFEPLSKRLFVFNVITGGFDLKKIDQRIDERMNKSTDDRLMFIKSDTTATTSDTDFMFCADVMKHFNTGYLNDNGFAVMDRKKVTTTYLTGWFLGDLLSSVPIGQWLGPILGPV